MREPSPSPDPFVDAVREYVARHDLLPEGAPVVVGVSGGADSMALLRVLLDLAAAETEAARSAAAAPAPRRVLAAHLDHAVRPDSAADAAFVREWCGRWGVELVEDRLEPPPGAAPPGEADLRDTRYAFLHRVAATAAAPAVIAVGHHADDRLETFLAQLVRGAGPGGLAHPRPRRADGVVRPLLERRRDEIEAWLSARGIPWRDDPTNADGSNLRSRLRRDVVPALLRENPGLARTVGRTADLLATVDDRLTAEALAALDALRVAERPGELILDGPRGRTYHPVVLSTLLREAARRLGLHPVPVGFDPLDRLARAWSLGERLALDPPGDLRIEVAPDRVRVVRVSSPAAPPAPRPLPVPGRVAWPGGPAGTGAAWALLVCGEPAPPPDDPRADAGPQVAWADADRLEGPLTVRGRLPGDRYRPLGAQGETKVQDLLVDRKVPRAERDRAPLVVDGAGIVWIPGLRVAERARITAATRRAVRLAAEPRSHEPDDPDPAEE